MPIIGTTGMEVSRLVLGTMTFGRPVPRRDAIEMVHWALDHGINFFDTADMYEGYDRTPGSAGGVAETILGDAVSDRRERAVLMTKVGCAIGSADYSGEGLSGAHIFHQIDASLQRLRTDHVDFYLLHRPDPRTPLAESLAAMARLIEQGKVRQWGFSNFDAPQIREMVALCDANGWPRPVISQPRYNWLNRDVEAEHLPTCAEFGIAVAPYQPLQGGLLTGKYRRDSPAPTDSRAADSPWLELPDGKLYDRLEQFQAEALRAGVPQATYALSWLLAHPQVAAVVVGSKRVDQLEPFLTLLD